jgi:uncharacterized membrane protein
MKPRVLAFVIFRIISIIILLLSAYQVISYLILPGIGGEYASVFLSKSLQTFVQGETIGVESKYSIFIVLSRGVAA